MIELLLVQRTRMQCELFASALRNEADISIAGFTHTGVDAQPYIRKRQCNTILIDIHLLDKALNVLRICTRKQPEIKILATNLVESNTAILRCIEEGIDGYVLEDDSMADLVKKLRAVHENEFIISPSVAAALMSRVAELKKMTKNLHGINSSYTESLFSTLTPREREVLRLVEQGYDNKEIAVRLVIEKGTVKNHVHNILNKLDVHCREQAALLARHLFTAQHSTELCQ